MADTDEFCRVLYLVSRVSSRPVVRLRNSHSPLISLPCTSTQFKGIIEISGAEIYHVGEEYVSVHL